MCHRDIKLANVLLTDSDQPVLMDFGSAAEAHVAIFNRKEAIALQVFARQLESPHHYQDKAAETCSMPYRAPELVDVQSNAQITDRTDIWVS